MRYAPGGAFEGADSLVLWVMGVVQCLGTTCRLRCPWYPYRHPCLALPRPVLSRLVLSCSRAFRFPFLSWPFSAHDVEVEVVVAVDLWMGGWVEVWMWS